MRTVLTCLLYMLFAGVFSQNIGINTDGSAPNSQALLHVNTGALPANGKRGYLGPAMTTAQRDASFPSPVEGLEIYNTDIHCKEFYNGTTWVSNCGSVPVNCPPGFVAVTEHLCIEISQHQNAQIFVANDTCMSKGARLCSWAEWHYACINATSLSLQGMMNDWEWADDVLHENNFLVSGDGGCEATTMQNQGTINSYRCCYSR